jgi:hypothetical protein
VFARRRSEAAPAWSPLQGCLISRFAGPSPLHYVAELYFFIV